MNDLEIKTILGIRPRKKLPEPYVITCGESFIVNYQVSNNFNQLEQLTFSFKQKQKIYFYKMFKYLVETEDTEVIEAKQYYKNREIIEGHECTAELVENPIGNPAELGYYEVVTEPEIGLNDLYYLIDNHFSYNKETNAVVFALSSSETICFIPTYPGTEVRFEIAIRYNTDSSSATANKDTVIIDRQPNIIVKDSLFSQISSDANTVKDDPEWLASIGRVVRE